MKRFAVLVSGGGTNLQTLIDRVEDGTIPAEITSVISSRSDAYALTRAADHGIRTRVINRKISGSQQDCDAALLNALREDGADFVVLAGYLSILGKQVVQEYANRIINTHPALLPSFGGKGYYGLHVHEAVLSYGAKVSGATIHFVDEGTDTGPIILQQCVPVLCGDTPEALQQRVLEVEHGLLPKAVALMAEGRLFIEGRKVIVREDMQ